MYLLITTSEIGIYDEWKTKLQYKALLYFSNPDEIYKSSETSVFFVLILIFLVQFGVSYWFYKRFIYTKIEKINRSFIFSGLFLFLISFMIFLGLRGGIGEIPLTQSN